MFDSRVKGGWGGGFTCEEDLHMKTRVWLCELLGHV